MMEKIIMVFAFVFTGFNAYALTNSLMINTTNAIVMGNENGDKRIIVFTDPSCPHCSKQQAEIIKLCKENQNIKIEEMLIPLFSKSKPKINSIVAISKKSREKAVKILEDAFNGKNITNNAKFNHDYSEENMNIAKLLKIDTTPTIILPNGQIIEGFKTKDDLKKLIE